jgi:DNA-binding CsgD family transcriptional regulator
MAKRNLTNPNVRSDWNLSQQQQTAVDLLVSGKNLQETADSIGVQRPTVSQWLHHNAAFIAAVNQRRQELWADLVDGLRALAPKALAVLARELDGEAPLPAAIHILRAVGLYGGIAAPSGETDPQAIALAMKLKEDDRQHAAEDAAIAIKRRSFDRMLAQLAADPVAGGWTPPT